MKEAMINTSNSSTDFNPVSRETRIAWSAIYLGIGFLIVVVNLATNLTFVINRHLRRRSVYCLINLAATDLLFGAVNILNDFSNTSYVVVNITLSLVYATSLFSLVLVSLERVYATFFPFRHRTTRLRMYIVMFTITWLLPLPLAITWHLYSNAFVFLTSIIILILCLLIICTSYTAIFVKVKNQTKRLQPYHQQTTAIQIRQKREQHLAMTLFIVTVLSLITWLPFIFELIITWHLSVHVPYHIFRFLISLQRTNSLINPIIYVLRMRDFRKALTHLIFKCSLDQQQVYPIGNHGNHGRQQQPPIELRVL